MYRKPTQKKIVTKILKIVIDEDEGSYRKLLKTLRNGKGVQEVKDVKDILMKPFWRLFYEDIY